VVVRTAEVFVQSLSPQEAQRLKRLSTGARHRSTRVRAMILLASATEMSAPAIARLYLTDASHVRHDFNERGSVRWTLTIGPGAHARRRPRSATASWRSQGPAPHQSVALTRRSIRKLAAHLDELGIAELSPSALRTLLDHAGLSFQRTRSWKWSPDPDFAEKAERVLAPYRQPPKDGPVVCFDEMGPIQRLSARRSIVSRIWVISSASSRRSTCSLTGGRRSAIASTVGPPVLSAVAASSS
jgi:hypothetical protein